MSMTALEAEILASHRLKKTTTKVRSVTGKVHFEERADDGGVIEADSNNTTNTSNNKVHDAEPVTHDGHFFVVDDRPDKELHQILPNLYLGSQDAAANREGLAACNVRYIVNAAFCPNHYPDLVTYLNLAIEDMPGFDILQLFEQSNQFLHSILASGNTSVATASPVNSSSSSSSSSSASSSSSSSPSCTASASASTPLPTTASVAAAASAAASATKAAAAAAAAAAGAVAAATAAAASAASTRKANPASSSTSGNSSSPAFSSLSSNSTDTVNNESTPRPPAVLVHCNAGISRSTTLILAYLVRHHHMTVDDAFALVKANRKQARPNDGFMDQLRKYAKQHESSVSSSSASSSRSSSSSSSSSNVHS